MNAFMVFSHHERKRVIAEDPKIENIQISKELGKRWKNLTDEEREPYIQEAEKLRQYHMKEYPDYKYKPTKRKQNIRTKYPSEENPSSRKPDGIMRSNSGPGVLGSGIRFNKINVSYGGPLRQLDPNRPLISLNNKFKNSLNKVKVRRQSLLTLQPPATQVSGVTSDLSPPAKVPYSPGSMVYPTTPDPHSQPFYADTRLDHLKTNVTAQSPHSRLVPMSPMTRSCPVTPLSRQYQHQPPHTPTPRHVTNPPSPMFSRQDQLTLDLDSASLPDLTSILDNFLPNSSSELSLDVGDLRLDFNQETSDQFSAAVAPTIAPATTTSSTLPMVPETVPENIEISAMEAMETIDNIRPEDLFDDNLIDLKLMEFVN